MFHIEHAVCHILEAKPNIPVTKLHYKILYFLNSFIFFSFFYFLSITNKYNIIQYSLLLSMLYMFQAVSLPIIRSSKTVHTASGICQACLLACLLLLTHTSSSSKQA